MRSACVLVSRFMGSCLRRSTKRVSLRRQGPIILIAIFVSLSPPALAVTPDEMLPDPALEARAREISAELRCLVCQNETIDDSNSDLAKSLRLIVRERLTAGDTNEQVIDFVHARFGDFVLMTPPISGKTGALWLAPVMALLLGGVFVFFQLRKKKE